MSVDSTVIRAPQHAAGARKRGAAGGELEDPSHAAARQAIGRSHGGLTSKVHLACYGRGQPLAVAVTPGNVNDSPVFDLVLVSLQCPGPVPGGPVASPMRSSRTRRTRPGRSARSCAGWVSGRWSRSGRIRRLTACGAEGRRQTTGLRPRALQGAEPGRTLLRSPQAVPRDRRPSSTNAPPATRRHPPRRTHPLAPRTRPRSFVRHGLLHAHPCMRRPSTPVLQETRASVPCCRARRCSGTRKYGLDSACVPRRRVRCRSPRICACTPVPACRVVCDHTQSAGCG